MSRSLAKCQRQEHIAKSNMANKCQASRLWVGRNECNDLSVSGILLISLVSSWGILFVVSGIRLVYLTRSAARNTDVAKKMQYFQAWFYSMFYTVVSVSSLFLLVSLIMEGQFVTGIIMTVFYLLSLAYSSQIDVIGTVNKSQGVNDIDPVTMVQYFTTIYLAKAVWKVSGHKERESSGPSEEEVTEKETGFGALLCLGEINNNRRPRVYDFKDVVGIQGAFLSLPTLFVIFVSYVRAYGSDSFQTQEEGDPEFKFDEFRLADLPLFLLIVSFVSALLTPLLGDWETLKKNAFYTVGSLFFRATELTARVLFYAFFIDATRFAGLLALGLEFAVMWFTTVNARDTSAAGRTDSISHKLLACWEAVFFTRYRRVHVDKEFVLKNNTLMPYTIELIRFLSKVIVTVIGYAIIGSSYSVTYTLGNTAKEDLPVFLLAGVAANLAVFVMNVLFFCVKRDKLKRADVSKVWSYWLTLQPCKFLCTPPVAHINRDNINYAAGDQNVPHYV